MFLGGLNWGGGILLGLNVCRKPEATCRPLFSGVPHQSAEVKAYRASTTGAAPIAAGPGWVPLVETCPFAGRLASSSLLSSNRVLALGDGERLSFDGSVAELGGPAAIHAHTGSTSILLAP